MERTATYRRFRESSGARSTGAHQAESPRARGVAAAVGKSHTSSATRCPCSGAGSRSRLPVSRYTKPPFLRDRDGIGTAIRASCAELGAAGPRATALLLGHSHGDRLRRAVRSLARRRNGRRLWLDGQPSRRASSAGGCAGGAGPVRLSCNIRRWVNLSRWATALQPRLKPSPLLDLGLTRRSRTTSTSRTTAAPRRERAEAGYLAQHSAPK
jgi:hypothetical protein